MNTPQRVLKALAAFGLAFLLVGCQSPRVLKGNPDLLGFLVDGKTTREEVVLALGAPSCRMDGERIITYRLGYERESLGYFVVGRESQASGWSTWIGAQYSLVIVLDSAGVVQRHSLVKVN